MIFLPTDEFGLVAKVTATNVVLKKASIDWFVHQQHKGSSKLLNRDASFRLQKATLTDGMIVDITRYI
jgi:hypothetical protein